MPDTKHTLLGHVRLGNPPVDFYSDLTKPLVFRTDLLGGYVLQQGGVGVIYVHSGRKANSIKAVLGDTLFDYNSDTGAVYLVGFSLSQTGQ